MIYRVKNWSQFQHFKDRKPPWIKLYRDLLDNRDYYELSDRTAKFLPLVWLVASEHDGLIPDDDHVAFRLRLSMTEAATILEELATAGFLIDSEETEQPQQSTAKLIAERNGYGSRHITDAVKREVWARDGGKCKACGSEEKIEYDHIHPVSKGGNSEIENVQLLCRKCNREKRAKTAEPTGLRMRSLETEEEKRRERDRRARDFEAFYAAYPKKKAPGDAERAFAKVDAPLEVLLAAIARQRKSEDWLKEQGRYIPYPATWLNQKQWKNEDAVSIEPPRRTGPDPALAKIKADAAKAAPPSLETLQKLAELRKPKEAA